MTLEEALFVHLAAQTDVAALLGDAVHDARIYRQVIPQHGKTPCCVMQRTTTQRAQANCGTIGTVRAIVQIDSYARTPEQAAQVADAIRYALTDLSATIEALRIKSTFLQNEFDLDDPEPGLYRRSQSWAIWFFEQQTN